MSTFVDATILEEGIGLSVFIDKGIAMKAVMLEKFLFGHKLGFDSRSLSFRRVVARSDGPSTSGVSTVGRSMTVLPDLGGFTADRFRSGACVVISITIRCTVTVSAVSAVTHRGSRAVVTISTVTVAGATGDSVDGHAKQICVDGLEHLGGANGNRPKITTKSKCQYHTVGTSRGIGGIADR